MYKNMKILITHLGNLNEILIASSILKTITQKTDKAEITWVNWSKEDKYIFKYNNYISHVLCLSELEFIKKDFDLLINLNPDLFLENNVNAKEAIGFDISDNFNDFKDILKGQTFQGEKPTFANEAVNLFEPLPITTYLELKNDPNSANVLIGTIADMLGISVNTYSGKSKKSSGGSRTSRTSRESRKTTSRTSR